MVSVVGLSLLLVSVQATVGSPPVRYQIHAAISGAENRLDARAILKIREQALGGSDSLHLALGGPGIRRLQVKGLTLSDGRQTPFRLTADSSEIVLPLRSSGPLEVAIEWSVIMDTVRRRQLGYDLLSATEPENSWYPTVISLPDSVRRFSDFDVTLEVPVGTALLTSGRVVDSTVAGIYVRRHERGDSLEGFTLAFAPGHVVLSSVSGGVVVHALSPAADTATWGRVAREASAAAGWYKQLYGFSPISSIGIVPGSRGARGGFPLPNVFMIHQGDLSPAFVRWITAHELAHYYWGLYVFAGRERLDWLMLGLGIWTNQLYLARTGGASLESQWRDPRADNSFEDFAVALMGNYDQRLELADSEVDVLSYDYNSYVRHAKGAIALYLLGRKAGADRFVAFQRELLTEFRHRPLSPETFANRLEAFGVSGVNAFLEAWVRGDARLDYAVRGVEPDPTRAGTYVIRVERTGTVPFPVVIEVRSMKGAPARVELSGDNATDSVQVALAGPVRNVRLDPDGLLPMWSSSNVEMRRTFLRAMGTAGPAEPFIDLAESHLANDPDPLVAAIAIERSFELGRFTQIQRLARTLPFVTRCDDRVTCLAAIQVARALNRIGANGQARALLRSLDAMVTPFGPAASRRLATAHAEVESVERR